jgi:hypothetical protein
MKHKLIAAFTVFFLVFFPRILLALDSHFVMVQAQDTEISIRKFNSAEFRRQPSTFSKVKNSEQATYFDIIVWEEIGAIHFYEFSNDYSDKMLSEIPQREEYELIPDRQLQACKVLSASNPYWAENPNLDVEIKECETALSKEITDYRESFAILKVSNMPAVYSGLQKEQKLYESAHAARSAFMKEAIIQFLKIIVPRYPDSEYSLTYNGHGAPGGALFSGLLSPKHSYDVLKTWRYLIGKNLAFIDMGGPCNKAGFSDLSTFCPFANYYIASDLLNFSSGTDSFCDPLSTGCGAEIKRRAQETDPGAQWHNILSTSSSLVEAMKKRIDLARQRYLYSINNMTASKNAEANYLFSCAAFNLFSPQYMEAVKEAAGSFYGTLKNPTLVDNGNYDLMESVEVTRDGFLIEALNQVKVYQADNRDFFEWEDNRNGISTPNFLSRYGSAVNLDLSKTLPKIPTNRPNLNTNSSSSVSISGGVTKDGGITYSNSVFPGDTISIRPVIEPDKDHSGKSLEIIVVLGNRANELFLLTANGLIPYADGEPVSYFFKTVGASRIFVPILDNYKYTGGNPDEYAIYIGYRLADETDEIFYNLEPITMSLY